MFRNSLPKIIILAALGVSSIAIVHGQPKPGSEVDFAKCWTYEFGDAAASVIASDGVRVYVGGGGQVDALSLDGQRMWRTEFGGGIISNILPLDEGLFFAVPVPTGGDKGNGGGDTLRVLSKETGITKLSIKLPEASEHYLAAYQGGIIVVSANGVVQYRDSKTGTAKWKRELADGFATAPRFLADKLIVASTAKQVFAISLATGEIDSMRKVPFNITAVGQTAAGDLMVGDERGNLTSFLGNTEKVTWKFRAGGEISTILPTGVNILITSHDNFAYSLVAKNGAVDWKRRLSGRVGRIATLEERYVLMSGIDDHGAVLTDLTNGKSAGQIVLGDLERINYNPVAASELIFLLTSDSIRSFGLNGCGAKKEGDPGK